MQLTLYLKTPHIKLGIWLVCLGIQFLTSCSSMDAYFLNNDIRFSFNPVVESEYKYEFEDADEVTQEIGKIENKTRLITRKKLAFLYKISQKSIDKYVVLVKLLSCEIENISDASSSSENPESDSTYFHKSINSLKGAIFELNLSLEGQIENVTGYQQYLDRCQVLGEKPYSENYFEGIFDRISQFPSHKAIAAPSPSRQDSTNYSLEYLTNEYTLEKKVNGRAHIHSSSQVKQQILAMNTKLLMTGIEYGEFEIETNTGMPINYSKVLKLQGMCKIGGVDVVQNLIKTSRLLGSKIN